MSLAPPILRLGAFATCFCTLNVTDTTLGAPNHLPMAPWNVEQMPAQPSQWLLCETFHALVNDIITHRSRFEYIVCLLTV
jgi:hypothetical protein